MTGERLAQRDYYGKALADLAPSRPDIVVMDADLAGSTKTSSFKAVAPERFVEVGIAEANMIGVAAGLAVSGKTVFASTFGVFASGRCWEQIRMAVAYPCLNVKVVATHCGLSVGPDGATHQALEDIALMRALPNMTVVVPADANEAYAATLALADFKGPAYMRMGRSKFPVITPAGQTFEIGKASVMREGSDVTIVACGQLVVSALEAADKLAASGVSAEVINMSTVKPLDGETLLRSVRKTGAAVTAEEHSIIGGLGSAVCEFLSENLPVPVCRVGTKDIFGESGEADELLVKYGLTADGIADAAVKAVSKKK
ncbi:transketolase [Candidatus Methanomethylophilus sp. 1R26]|uniref:transketolase family protein n=1 Tax=Candidatus Methanomethylophilus sp. 1R26 TaxID=1769296 RepID=UPI000736DC32|nr:transketolase family protein [Candidatus Methanomethylophilus sp. 1R26]KUE73881.1 transketolase [Candidatus Methanomethylophilus sp. 1R26]MEE3400940.1 transketolase family protein [Methanomethylophilus sp.]